MHPLAHTLSSARVTEFIDLDFISEVSQHHHVPRNEMSMMNMTQLFLVTVKHPNLKNDWQEIKVLYGVFFFFFREKKWELKLPMGMFYMIKDKAKDVSLEPFFILPQCWCSSYTLWNIIPLRVRLCSPLTNSCKKPRWEKVKAGMCATFLGTMIVNFALKKWPKDL